MWAAVVFLVAGLLLPGHGRRPATPMEIRTGNILTCDVCQAFAVLLEAAFALGQTETELLTAASHLCSRILPFNQVKAKTKKEKEKEKQKLTDLLPF